MANSMSKITLGLLLTFTTVAVSARDKAENAHARLESPGMQDLRAHVQLMDTKDGVKIKAYVSGLNPGSVHGFHIHEKGECKGPDFKSAGDHLNPDDHPHRGPAAAQKHLGDLGNLVANAKGVAFKEMVIPAKEARGLKNLIGKAFILHANADDLTSQPSGGAGERIACGVIKAGKL